MNAANTNSIPRIDTDPSANWDIKPNYAFIRCIGCGSYGSVCDALFVKSKTRVAIKKFQNVFEEPTKCKRILREIELLFSINHPNVVKPLDVFMRQGSDLYLVMEMGQVDLNNLRRMIFLVDKQVKVIMYKLLVALNYLHSGGILHRDIKPANILINSDCSVKLCDFSLGRSITGLASSYFDCGLVFAKDPTWNEPDRDAEENGSDEIDEGSKAISKTVHCRFEVNFDHSSKDGEMAETASNVEAKKREQRNILLCASKAYNKNCERELSGYIATRWYRPPEVILLEKFYNTAVDMWGVGCVFAELLEMIKENQPDISKRSVLFPGKSCFPLSPSKDPTGKTLGMPTSPCDQLNIILNVFGTPCATDLSFLNDQRAEDYVKEIAASKAKLDLKTRLPAADKDAIDLLTKLLAFNPYYRITAKEALHHPYFDGIRNKDFECEMSKPVILQTDTLKANSLQTLVNTILLKIIGNAM